MARRGCGVGYGGVSVLNAIATGGVGGAVGLSLSTRACVEMPGSGRGVSETPAGQLRIPNRLMESVRNAVTRIAGFGVPRFDARVDSEVPPGSGLKSSSALSVALVRAVADAMGLDVTGFEVARAAMEASIEAGTTVTGAFDDHLASAVGGVHITVNRGVDSRLLYTARWRGPRKVLVAVRGSRDVTSVSPGEYKWLSHLYSSAAALALKGMWLEAMRLNGLLTAIAIGAEKAVLDAYRQGAWAAGVSGKGPAVYAIPGARSVEELGSRGYKVLESTIRG